ncbi:transmembrane signal receptor [Lithospermum erythrorhizon]|uniref:Transmembrane signal receptor n=1 Tax=Lithospermum erythrorhizon TaxID=34254 RepID=A0AAV3Q2F8_LITER
MLDEYDALIGNKTWDLVPRPHDVIRSLWIFKHKKRSDGSFERYKTRLVGDGASQQPDVKNTFLHGKIDETVYMYQPLSFRSSQFPDHGEQVAYILLYVDDIILATSSDALRTSIMHHLHSEFSMKDLGPLSYFLGMSVTSTSQHIFLSQRKYAKEIIEKAGISSCKSSTTHVDSNAKLSVSSGNPYHNPTEYRSLASALQYLTLTRPDIFYAIQQVCLFMHDPRTQHMNAYSESTSGYCVYLGDNIISWSTKRQATFSWSSVEAKYLRVANVVSESCWIRNILLELHFPISTATIVYCDNVSAVYLAGNPVHHQRTKHIEMDIHFIRKKVSRCQVPVTHIPSRSQIADIFTKGLPLKLFEDFRSSLNVHPPSIFVH